MNIRVAVVVASAVVASCGTAASTVRMATYEQSQQQVVEATVEVLREIGYPARAPIAGESHTRIDAGPLVYDADKQRIAVAADAPEARIKANVMIRVVSGRLENERYLDIIVTAWERDGAGWKVHPTARPFGQGGMTRSRRSRDRYEWSTWLSSIVDPIHNGVYARLAEK